MRKSRMFLLFGTLLAMVVGYVAWCSRTFYVRAGLPDLSTLEEEARPVAIAGIEASGMREPEKFSFGRFKDLLAKPYDSAPPPIMVKMRNPKVLYIHRGFRWESIVLARYPSGWASVPFNEKTPY